MTILLPVSADASRDDALRLAVDTEVCLGEEVLALFVVDLAGGRAHLFLRM